MTTGKPIVYWDACVFLSWIKNENRPNNEMDGVNAVAQKIDKDHVILLTSDITIGEILDSTLDDNARQKLKDIFKRRNCRSVAADRRVNSLASEIRDYYQQRKDIDLLPTLMLPDAIHLATAILYSVTEFHTFDANDGRNKKRAILPLNGNVAGYPLVICKPPLPDRGPLFRGLPVPIKEEKTVPTTIESSTENLRKEDEPKDAQNNAPVVKQDEEKAIDEKNKENGNAREG